MAKYEFSRLIGGKWEVKETVQAQGRKRAQKKLIEMEQTMKSGLFKIRKISD